VRSKVLYKVGDKDSFISLLQDDHDLRDNF